MVILITISNTSLFLYFVQTILEKLFLWTRLCRSSESDLSSPKTWDLSQTRLCSTNTFSQGCCLEEESSKFLWLSQNNRVGFTIFAMSLPKASVSAKQGTQWGWEFLLCIRRQVGKQALCLEMHYPPLKLDFTWHVGSELKISYLGHPVNS